MKKTKKTGWVWRYVELIRLSVGASLLIGLGNFVLLKLGEPVGPFLFAFGLLGVCVLGLNLFTGKCGFLFEDKLRILDLLIILVVNLVSGYLFGVLFGFMDGTIVAGAEAKVLAWGLTWEFFLKSVMCGVIMYLAVELYRRGTKLGILLGVPLFIFCGFQHSIANVITMGVALQFSWTIFLCAAGNFVGAIVAWSFCRKSGEVTSKKDGK
ncbi:formate/nitrite transporter family protein [Candidatus Saccharibacteria bacterium]|nr:formate/nitrite transporter family protein [Candidatus Saccharibacteria bacterium]